MTELVESVSDDAPSIVSEDEPLTRALLLLTFFGSLFYSFCNVAFLQPLFHMGFNEYWPILAVVPVCLTIAIGSAFVFARFSFGYLVGFYLFTMIAGFFWLNRFSILNYDHDRALASATISIVLFLLPVLTVRGGRSPFQLPAKWFDRIPDAILIFSIAILVLCALDGFRFVGIGETEKYRSQMAVGRSSLVNYAIGNINGALIPFAFACAWLRGRKWLLLALCAVSLLYYPVTLTKTALFTAPFMLFIAFIADRFEGRVAVILSLMIPLLIGLGTIAGISWEAMDNTRLLIFGTINFRMLAIPSVSLEHYFEFFQQNPLTEFCQISFLKSMTNCPYADQLGVVLAHEYRLGNMNASLFATEGLASVGPAWMPVASLVCGFVLALGNKAANGLPARFILISGAIIPHTLLDVPLSTTLLSNGLGLLMLLWYLTPRSLGDRDYFTVNRTQ